LKRQIQYNVKIETWNKQTKWQRRSLCPKHILAVYILFLLPNIFFPSLLPPFCHFSFSINVFSFQHCVIRYCGNQMFATLANLLQKNFFKRTIVRYGLPSTYVFSLFLLMDSQHFYRYYKVHDYIIYIIKYIRMY